MILLWISLVRFGGYPKALSAFGSFYACHAYRADERGSCEHVIRWLREFFPKGQTLDQVTDEYLKEVQDIINRRPRKIFGGLAPIELHFPARRAQTVRT